jgi:hypothetical protein
VEPRPRGDRGLLLPGAQARLRDQGDGLRARAGPADRPSHARDPAGRPARRGVVRALFRGGEHGRSSSSRSGSASPRRRRPTACSTSRSGRSRTASSSWSTSSTLSCR